MRDHLHEFGRWTVQEVLRVQYPGLAGIARNARAHRAYNVCVVGSPSFVSYLSAAQGFRAAQAVIVDPTHPSPRYAGRLEGIRVYADSIIPHQTGYIAVKPRTRALEPLSLVEA